MKNNNSEQKINDILKNKEKLKDKSPEDLLKSLKPEDAKKVQNVMNNPELTKKIMNSPQAQALIKRLMGDKNE